MSTKSPTTTPKNQQDNNNITHHIEQYLAELVEDGHVYIRSREIASDLGYRTKQVAALLSDVNEQSEEFEIEKWAYSNSTTWLVEPTQ